MKLCTWSCRSNVDNGRKVDLLRSGLEADWIKRPQEASLRGRDVGRRPGWEGVDVAGPVVGHLSGNDRGHLEEVANQECTKKPRKNSCEFVSVLRHVLYK